MKNIEFYIPIYADVISLAKNGLNIKEAVLLQMHQGDPSVDDITNELQERFGDSDEVENAIVEDFYDFIFPKEDSLIIDRDETFSLGFHNGCCDTVAFGVDCIFDVEKWADTYGLEELKEEENKECYEIE